jgi:putative phosphoesterase
MKILIMSDTHAKRYSDLPEVLRSEIEKSDAVIHAGDYGSGSFLKEFVSRCVRFYGVLGNNDSAPEHKGIILPRELVLDLDGIKIAVIHSDMALGDREGYLLRNFHKSSPDLIVYGHTHRGIKHASAKPVIINPGSPTRTRGEFNSYALLETAVKSSADRRWMVDIKKI